MMLKGMFFKYLKCAEISYSDCWSIDVDSLMYCIGLLRFSLYDFLHVCVCVCID